MVPQLVTCHKCNSVLYESIELKPLDEIIQSYDGRCPTCRRKLPHIPKDFEVKPVDIVDQPKPFEPKKKKTLSRKKRPKTHKAETSRRSDHVRKRRLKKKKVVHERKDRPGRRPIDYDYSWPFFRKQRRVTIEK